jgi:hypothetical protein
MLSGLAVLLFSGIWSLTPAVAQAPAGTPTYNVNAKWVTDKGSQLYNVKAYGALCNGTADDTAAIQSVLNIVNSARAGGQGLPARIYIPATAGGCKISSPLLLAAPYANQTTGAQYVGIEIEGESSGQGSGTTLNWAGPSGGTMLEVLGCNSCKFQNISFNQANSARLGIDLDADNDVQGVTVTATISAGSQTVTPTSMGSIWLGRLLGVDSGSNFEAVYVTAVTGSTFTATFAKAHSGTWQVGGNNITNDVVLDKVQMQNVPNGAGTGGTGWGSHYGTATAGLLLGGTGEVSEIKVTNSVFSGYASSATGADACVAIPSGGNNMNYWFENNSYINCQDAAYLVNGGATHFKGGTTANITVYDFYGSTPQVTIEGIEAESNTPHPFGYFACAGGGSVTLIHIVFNENAPPNNIGLINGGCPLTMIGNLWGGYHNFPFKVQVDSHINFSPYSAGGWIMGAGAITGIGNSYSFDVANPSGYAPFVSEQSGHPSLFPVCTTNACMNSAQSAFVPAGTPVNIVSEGDYALDTGGHQWPLQNWSGGRQIGSSAGVIPSNGLVNAASGDSTVCQENNAGTGSNCLSQNSSNQPTWGGSTFSGSTDCDPINGTFNCNVEHWTNPGLLTNGGNQTFGDLGWLAYTVGTACSTTAITASNNSSLTSSQMPLYPFVAAITPAGTSGTGCWLQPKFLRYNQFQYLGSFTNVLRFAPMALTNIVRAGWASPGPTTNVPTAGFYARYDPSLSDTTIMLCSNSSSTETCSSSGVAVAANTMYKVALAYVSSGEYSMSVNGGTPVTFCASGCTVTATVPTNVWLSPSFEIATNAAASNVALIAEWDFKAGPFSGR